MRIICTGICILAFCLVPGSAQALEVAGLQSGVQQRGIQSPLPAHPATENQLREYFEVTGMERVTRENLINAVDQSRRASPPFVPKVVWDEIKAEMTKLDIVSLLISTYQKYFSEEDLRDILAFYRTASGQKLLITARSLTAEAGQVLDQKTEALTLAVYEKHKVELDAAEKKYEATDQSPK